MLERVEELHSGASSRFKPAGANDMATEDEIIQFLISQQRLASEQEPLDGVAVPHVILYEDPDFNPAQLTTLYIDPSKLPEYAAFRADEDRDDGADESINAERGSNGVGGVFWYRPTEYADDPDYFKSTAGCGIVREGPLNDAWLLGVFAAIALHPDNLIENLFVSESIHAFKEYGVYTCRFYKNGGWVTVTTDTRVPYSLELHDDDKFPSKGMSTPGNVLYGSSVNKNEVFLPFLEKAFAKLHGSYQVVAESNGGNMSGKILEAFLDCTGGSAHRIDLVDELRVHGRMDGDTDDDSDGAAATRSANLWKKMLRYKRKKCILTAQLKQLSFNAYDMTATGIIKNRQYVVQHVKEVGVPAANPTASGSGTTTATTTLRFVKLKNIWGRGMWKGEWSNDDSKWEEHMQVENALRSDPACAFSRSGNDGCFWMIWEDFVDTFNELFVVHVFANDDIFQYCVQGEWCGHSAAGAPAKDHSSSSSLSTPTAASAAKVSEKPIDKTKWSVLHDAEANWYRNPQYKLTVREKTSGVLISLAQRDFRLYGGDNYAINFVVLREKASRATVVWEFRRSHVVAEAHSYEPQGDLALLPTTPSNTAAGSSNGSPRQLPEREISRDELVLEPDVAYFVVPYTDTAKVDMEFFLRIFSPKHVHVERVAPLSTCVVQGKWRNDEEESGDPTNAGGPLCTQLHGGDENAAWCQNPQFWVRLEKLTRQKHAAVMASKPHVTLKVIVRKTSHKASGVAGKARQRDAAAKDKSQLVGVTAVRATPNATVPTLDDSKSASSTASVLRAHAKAPKTNFLGEIVEKPFAKSAASSGHSHGAKWHGGSGPEAKGVDLNDYDQDDDADAKAQPLSPSRPGRILFPAPRLLVTPDEWCRVSEYASPAWSCLFLRKVPKDWLVETESNGGGGLMLVPSLGEAGAEGTFELQVDCDFPLVMDELPTFKSTQSVPGEWTEATAMGCHLHSEWKKNPKLYLHLKGVRPAKVQITVTRSELEWRAKCKRDAVGTMLGFYLFHGQKLSRESSAIIVNGRPWSETDFVPLHAVHAPQELVLPPAFNEPYVIMPATYEPRKTGKFVVCVTCDVEFTLSSDPE